MEEIKECHLNKNGNCTCYLEKCVEISDCATKLIIQRNILTVNKLINEK